MVNAVCHACGTDFDAIPIKPEHILLAPDGHIRLIDFDAAREPKADEVQDTRLLGTRGYAPPEQFGFAQTDARADLYALGATFRQLLGPVARQGRWRNILRRCTALAPKDRYASAGQIRRAVYRGRVFRWAVRPACAVLLALLLFVSGAVLTNSSSRLALFSVLGLADTQVWEEEQRLYNPHQHYVNMSRDAYDLKMRLRDEHHTR